MKIIFNDLKFGSEKKVKLERFELVADCGLKTSITIHPLYVRCAINLKAKMASVKHCLLLIRQL